MILDNSCNSLRDGGCDSAASSIGDNWRPKVPFFFQVWTSAFIPRKKEMTYRVRRTYLRFFLTNALFVL